MFKSLPLIGFVELGRFKALVLLISIVIPGDLANRAAMSMSDDRLALSQPLTVSWRYDSESTVNLTPATDGGRVYLPLAGGSLVTLRASDGQLFWKSEIGGELSASPAADNSGVYVASETVVAVNEARAGAALRALDREGGITRWLRALPGKLQGKVAISEERVFAGSSDGRVYSFSKRDGSIAWTMEYPTPFSSEPALSGRNLYLGNDDGTLFALDQKTGTAVWRYRTHGPIRGRPAIVDGVVYFGSADGYVYALDESDGHRRWRVRTGAAVQAVASGSNGLLVASLDNFVYFLSFSHGNLVWKRQMAGRLASQPLLTPDAALLTPLASDSAVVLDLHDGKQLNNLPLGEEDNSTAASPIVAGSSIFLTTRHGLLAFSRPPGGAQSPNTTGRVSR
jgi:outer membrane protein assembly factor BamB